MALSFAQYPGTGSQRNFVVPFGYLSKAHVGVKVNGVTVAFSWLNAGTVQLDVAVPTPTASDIVEVKRTTPIGAVLVDFQDASTLTESDLDTATLQNFYIAQETQDAALASILLTADGTYDAQAHRLKNLADATGPTEAVTKQQLDSAVVAAGNVPTPGSGGIGKWLKATTASVWAWASITLADIVDATAFGRSVVAAADASATRSLIGIKGVAQVVNTQTGAVATGTTAIPNDDTIPQITEGDQYMTLSITPKNAGSTLLIDVTFIGSNSNSGGAFVVALFQDLTANAIAAATFTNPGAGQIPTISFRHKMLAGATSATTFKVRAGGSTGATTTFNGAAGSRALGGAFASSITITEVLP